MKYGPTLRTALKALRRNMMRAALTILGIVIGIAAVITMVEIGRGTSGAVKDMITSLGANVIQIDPSDAVKAGASTGAGGRVTLTPADCEAIRTECGAVRLAAYSMDIKAQVVYGNRNWAPQDVRGTLPDYLKVREWPVAAGECFTDKDVRTAALVCLLGQTVAHELFQDESPLGRQVRIKDVTMKVIGVLTSKGANMMGRDQDDYVLAPFTTIKFRLSGVRAATVPAADTAVAAYALDQIYSSQAPQLYPQPSAVQAADYPQMTRFADVEDIFVSVPSPEEVPLAILQITAVLRERHRLKDGEPDDFRIRDLTEISTTMASTGRLMGNLLLCVALISLVVGGVGIMNVMLVSVTERTREIGLRMAVGARPRDILWQFLAEALVLCLAGGVIGIALGQVSSYLVRVVFSWPTGTSLAAVFAAVGVAAGVGVVFGFYPAWKASRLDPIEALRYE